jgi:hypothetical protein
MRINDYFAIRTMRRMIADNYDIISCCKKYRELTGEGLFYTKMLYESMLARIDDENSRLRGLKKND